MKPAPPSLKKALLDARERRQALLEEQLQGAGNCVVMLSLNLPGEDKTGERAESLFSWGVRQLRQSVPLLQQTAAGADTLGPYAFFSADAPASDTKRATVALEESAPAGRLLDLDVYDQSGKEMDRKALGLPPRPCLLCPDDAVACMRVQRHDRVQLQEKVDALIETV